MADIQDWVDDLLVEVPEPTELTIARAVRFSIQEFFRQSESWRVTKTVSVVEGTSSYLIPLPQETFILAADYAYFIDESGLRSQLNSTLEERVDSNSTSNPSEFYVTQTSFIINPASKTGTAEVGVIVSPKREIDTVPDELASKWFEYIRSGALARILAMPDKVWSNINIAAVNENVFLRGILEAKREARRDRSRPVRTVKYGGIKW